MIKIMILLVLALLGAGCTEEGRAEQRERIRRDLPDGCEMRDLGSYAEIDRVIVITCDGGRQTTMTQTYYSYSSGKTHVIKQGVAVEIGGES